VSPRNFVLPDQIWKDFQIIRRPDGPEAARRAPCHAFRVGRALIAGAEKYSHDLLWHTHFWRMHSAHIARLRLQRAAGDRLSR
jgi:hypothetical protein